MSVLIKGIGIPESCAECRFCVNGFTDDAPMYECACQSYDNVSVLVDKDGQPFDFRPEWCPLIEVQTPHGRLIDADAFVEDLTNSADKVWNLLSPVTQQAIRRVCDDIKKYPTIIEAEGSDNG